MKKKFVSIIIICMVFFIILIVYLWNIQESLFFYPWHDEESYVALKEMDNFEEINIDNNGKLLNGWLKYNTSGEKQPLVIFFNGNSGNSSHTCMYFENNNKFDFFEGYNILIIDYPGYGLSEGSPSDTTMFEAALSIYDYAIGLEKVDANNIVILGYSIGTGVATYLSSQRDIKGLILIAPYDNALNLYNDNLNIFYGPIKLLAKYKFNSILYAQSVEIDPLIIASYDDEVINYKHSLKLSEYFKSVNKMIVLNGIYHNDYFESDIVFENIYEYLQEKL